MSIACIADAIETCFGPRNAQGTKCPHCPRVYMEQPNGNPFRCQCENWVQWHDGKLIACKDAS